MTRASRTTTYLLVALGLVAVVVAELHLGLPDPDLSIKNHHIQHVFFILGGGLWGLALAGSLMPAGGKEPRRGRSAWLALAIAAPLAAMFLMWPSTYEYLEAHPLVHALDHGVFIVLSGLTTFAGYQFARSIGWVVGAALTVMAWAAAFGFGVTPAPNPLLTASATTPAASTTAAASTGAASTAAASTAAAVDGATVYQNCAACHQPQGTGLPGAFPPLAGHVPTLLAAQGGRDYVVRVLLYGLQGPITVDGKTYNGAMPSWAHLSDAELAAVIDYVSTSWGDEFPSGQQPYTANDVEEARAKELTPQEVHDLRETLNLP